jgi:hypothetical protein
MSNDQITIAEEMKELLSDPKNKIKLDDFVSQHIKSFLSEADLQNFPIQGINPDKESFLDRLQKYEEITKDLQQIVILLAKWGDQNQLLLLKKVFDRLVETDKGSSGLVFWINFGWYPLQILMYSAGISALSAKKYDALKIILETPIRLLPHEGKNTILIIPVASRLSEITEGFKWIPGHESKHTPRSEHLFQLLQPVLENILFLGKSYEQLFDDFEIHSALVFSDATGRDWAPIGRFGWKHERGREGSPFDLIIEEAKKDGENWPPLKAGLFHGSLEKFLELSTTFRERLNKLSWW